MTTFTTAILSVMSALIVAVVTHVLGKKRKQRDELSEARLKAYTDFINSASRLVSARRLGRVIDQPEELAILNDAKTRICISGDPQVVAALVKFWAEGGTLEREGEILTFTRLCLSMREALVGNRGDLQGIEISDTLFRVQPSTYSFKGAPRPPRPAEDV